MNKYDMTAEELAIVAERERRVSNFREGFQEAVFIIAVIALFVWGCWVFA